MKQKLDHIWGNTSSGGVSQDEFNTLNNKVTNLSQITAKTNLAQSFTGKQTFNGGFTLGLGQVAEFSTKIRLGYGAGTCYITPEDNTTKTLFFGGDAGFGNFNIDLRNTDRIRNVPTPTANGDVVNKQYVDTNAARLGVNNTFTTDQTINGNVKCNGIYKEGTTQTLVNIKEQGQKTINIDFEQNESGFLNYCNLNIRHKFANENWSDLTSLSFRNDGLFANIRNNNITFNNKTSINNAVNTMLKQIVSQSTDFNDFKRRIGQW